MNNINSISSTRRDVEEVKKRWQDIKRRTKEKVTFNRAQSRKTGSGSPVIDELSNIEEVVQQSRVAEQVDGVDGLDTAEISVENEVVCYHTVVLASCMCSLLCLLLYILHH